MIKVYMGVPSMGTRVDSQCYALRHLEKKYKEHIEFVYPEECVHISFHDAARNHVVEDFLKTDCDVLWFLDNDVTPPETVLDLLVNEYDKWEVAGAPCPTWAKPKGQEYLTVVFNVYHSCKTAFTPAAIPPKGQEFVEGLGTGCMFIKRSLFSKIEKPYFEFKYEDEMRKITTGEDLGFCKKINAAGVNILVDYAQLCKHQKTVCLLDVNNYAIDSINKSIAAYSKMLKEAYQEKANKKIISLR